MSRSSVQCNLNRWLMKGGRTLQLTTDRLPTLQTYLSDVYHQQKAYKLPCLIVEGTGPSLLGRYAYWLEHLELGRSAVHQMDNVDYVNMFPELSKDGLVKFWDIKAKLNIDSEVMSHSFKPQKAPSDSIVPTMLHTFASRQLWTVATVATPHRQCQL